MSRRRDLEQKMGTLSEIRGIMGSLKTLALLETRKLGRYLASQREAVAVVERAAAEVLAFHSFPAQEQAAHLVVVLGSERGFCGDYNEVLARALEDRQVDLVVAVGHKLHSRVPGNESVLRVQGPCVAEEVGRVLVDLADLLGDRARAGPAKLSVLHHDPALRGVREVSVLPPFLDQARPDLPYPPRLNLSPGDLLACLVDHYLLAVLHELFYCALLAENQARMQHLEAAVDHLDARVDRMTTRRNVLRQEEITEEIEVIMLNYQDLAADPGSRKACRRAAGEGGSPS